MTLNFAAIGDLVLDAPRVVEALRRRGAAVLPAPPCDAADAWVLLRAGALDLVLVPGDAAPAAEDGLATLAVLRRDEPRDVLIPADGAPVTLASLEAGARVGVAGARRRGYLRAHRKDVTPVPPGNGGGPAQALRSGSVDALILGAPEARRLSLGHLAAEALDLKSWVPSPGQGSRVLVGRADVQRPGGVGALDDGVSRTALATELAAAAALGAAGDAPVGVLAVPHGRWIRAWGMAASADGRRVVRADLTGPSDAPGSVGRDLAELLLARGAGLLLEGGAR